VLLQLELLPPTIVEATQRSYDNYYRSITFFDTSGSETSARQVSPSCRIIVKFEQTTDVSCLVQPNKSSGLGCAMTMIDIFGSRFAKER
jgi:hypothetical protein